MNTTAQDLTGRLTHYVSVMPTTGRPADVPSLQRARAEGLPMTDRLLAGGPILYVFVQASTEAEARALVADVVATEAHVIDSGSAHAGARRVAIATKLLSGIGRS